LQKSGWFYDKRVSKRRKRGINDNNDNNKDSDNVDVIDSKTNNNMKIEE